MTDKQPAAVEPSDQGGLEPMGADEQALWDRLERESADDGMDEAPEGEASEQPDGNAGKSEQPQPESDAKKAIPPEEIERRYRNLQGALSEERESAKALRHRLQNMESVIRTVLEKSVDQGQRQDAAPKIPDRNEDPIGYFEHKIAELERANAELRDGTSRTQEAMTRQAAQRQFWDAVGRDEQMFREQVKDYDDAVGWLEQHRMKELELMLPDNHPAAIQAAHEGGYESVAQLRMAALNHDRINVAQQAFQTRRNPAELYYSLAKARGFQGRAPAPQAANGAIGATKAGQAAARTLSSGRGSSDGTLTVTDLAQLYLEDPDRADKEFARAKAKGLLG